MSQSRAHSRHFPIALSVLLAACSDSPQEPPLEECVDNQVTLTATQGAVPTFSWSPSCGMSSMQVFPSSGGASVWVFYGGEQAETNPFRSPINYGHAPSGAFVATGPEPLRAGTEYTVIVYRWIGDPGGGGSIFDAGSATFVR
jgi:hypothetical protein